MLNYGKNISNRFKKYNWEQINLKGKVKSITTLKHNLKDQNGIIIIDRNSDFFDKKEMDYFEKNGNLIKGLSFENRNIRTSLLVITYGNKNYASNFKYYDEKDELITELKIEHLKNGNTLEKWSSGGENLIEYNLEKSIIEKYCYYDDGSLSWKEKYKYFYFKNLTEWTRLDGRTRSKIVTKANSLGYIIEENEYNSNENISKKIIYKYKLDKNKNWIEKKKFLIKNNVEIPKTIFEREIIYY